MTPTVGAALLDTDVFSSLYVAPAAATDRPANALDMATVREEVVERIDGGTVWPSSTVFPGPTQGEDYDTGPGCSSS